MTDISFSHRCFLFCTVVHSKRRQLPVLTFAACFFVQHSLMSRPTRWHWLRNALGDFQRSLLEPNDDASACLKIDPLYSHNRSSKSETQTEMSSNRHRLSAEVQIQIVRICMPLFASSHRSSKPSKRERERRHFSMFNNRFRSLLCLFDWDVLHSFTVTIEFDDKKLMNTSLYVLILESLFIMRTFSRSTHHQLQL